jgi:hypothetical protein
MITSELVKTHFALTNYTNKSEISTKLVEFRRSMVSFPHSCFFSFLLSHYTSRREKQLSTYKYVSPYIFYLTLLSFIKPF